MDQKRDRPTGDSRRLSDSDYSSASPATERVNFCNNLGESAMNPIDNFLSRPDRASKTPRDGYHDD